MTTNIYYKKTKGFCPVCKKILDANLIEKEGSIYMEKECDEHGKFESKVAKYAWYYKGLETYRNILFDKDYFKNHPSYIYTTSITEKCNLSCSICFAKPKNKNDISFEFFKEELKKLKNKNVTIHFSGGEPTLREDLPELIKLVNKYGNKIAVFTNGVKIANDLKYLKKLKKCGLRTIFLWFDAFDRDIEIKMRGFEYVDLKMKAIENIKKLKIPLIILAVIAKNINEKEIENLIKFVKENEFIHTLYFRGYNYLGERGFSPDQEFLIDELIESISNHSGLFSLEDIYFWQKIHWTFQAINNQMPSCCDSVSIPIPRKKEKRVQDIFRIEEFSKILDEFEKIWHENKKKAKQYFLSNVWNKISTKTDLRYLFKFFNKSHYGFCDPPPFKHYFSLLITTIRKLENFDIEKTQQECVNRSFNLGIDNNKPRCFELVTSY